MKRILYVQYTNPATYPPLEHSGLFLLNAGWDVRYFGIHSEGESNRLTFPAALARRQTSWQWTRPGWRQKLHYAWFTVAAVWHALQHRVDWVYCSDLLSCPAGWMIRRLTRCQVLYHEHDAPSGGREAAGDERRTDERPPLSGFQRFLLWTRDRVGRQAELVVLPNQKRLDLFLQTAGRHDKALCVFNCPRTDEVRPRRSPSPAGARLRLAFHGSINRDRLPMALLPALARFQGAATLQIVGYTTIGSSDYLAAFLAEAKRLGIDGVVECRGALPRQDLFASVAHCDVGLAFVPLRGGDVNMANMTGASNKPFDYLACGLALLASARPDWEDMFIQPGYGLACDPLAVDSIAAQLRWFLEHPRETREMGERGRQRVLREWNYESQFAKVLARSSKQPLPLRANQNLRNSASMTAKIAFFDSTPPYAPAAGGIATYIRHRACLLGDRDFEVWWANEESLARWLPQDRAWADRRTIPAPPGGDACSVAGPYWLRHGTS